MKTQLLTLALLFISFITHGQSIALSSNIYNGCGPNEISFSATVVGIKTSSLTVTDSSKSFTLQLFPDNNDVFKGSVVLDAGVHEPYCIANDQAKTTQSIDKPIVLSKAPSAYFNAEISNAFDSISQQTTYKLQLNNATLDDSISSIEFVVIKTYNTYGESVNNLIDSFYSNDYTSSFSLKLKPGKYNIKCRIKTTKQNLQCPINELLTEYSRSVQVGHFVSVRNKTVCLGDSTTFYDSVFYWNRQRICDVSNDLNNSSCINRASFFSRPDSNELRKYWSRRMNYTKPTFKEQMGYDFDRDGRLDVNLKSLDIGIDSVPFNQWKIAGQAIRYSFPTAGTHVVDFWTRDSLGQWQKDTFPVLIQDLRVDIVGDSNVFCKPHRVKYTSKSRGKLTPLNRANWYLDNNLIYKNTAVDTTISIDLAKTGGHNLEIEVLGEKGCRSKRELKRISLFAPRAKFDLESDSIACLPYNLKATAKLVPDGVYIWALNNRTVVNTGQGRYLEASIDSAAEYRLSLTVRKTYISAENGDTFTCAEHFESPSEINLKEKVKAGFTRTHLDNFVVKFDDKSQNGSDIVIWSFYEGSTLFGLSPLKPGQSISYDFKKRGDYKVCQLVSNGNCVDSICQKFWVAPNSTGQAAAQKLKLYPSPVRNDLFIEYWTDAADWTPVLYDLAGRIVLRGEKVQDHKTRLNLSHLPAGVYLLEVNGSMQKIIKE